MDAPPYTLEGLKQKAMNSFLLSEKAIRSQPEVYRDVKAILCRVFSSTIDVADYYDLARELAGLLRSLTLVGGDTIFHYFCQQIDPAQKGDVRYFRAMCKDLADQLDILNNWRARQRKICLVK